MDEAINLIWKYRSEENEDQRMSVRDEVAKINQEQQEKGHPCMFISPKPNHHIHVTDVIHSWRGEWLYRRYGYDKQKIRRESARHEIGGDHEWKHPCICGADISVYKESKEFTKTVWDDEITVKKNRFECLNCGHNGFVSTEVDIHG